MLRRLIVLRHAKSSWGTDAPDDHSRPLNKRGRRDAPRVAERIVELGWAPDRVFSSDSQRTRETWSLLAAAFGGQTDVEFTRDFYHGGLGSVRDALSEIGDDVGTVMIIGHNPGWEVLVSKLIGEDVTMTTCNAALLEADADSWDEASELESCWRMHELIRPREL